MRHRVKGRKLGRNASHRRAMFRNMASSLICSVRVNEDDPQKPKVPGRIVTTVAKAKELRPYVEKLVTLARKARAHEERAADFATNAKVNSEQWKNWRESTQWNEWNQAIAPAVALRRRAFAALRNREAVDVLFDELATRFMDRPGGYTRVVRLATPRLGDAGVQALIEFVGERDRTPTAKRQAPIVADEDTPEESAATPAGEEQAASENAPAEASSESSTGESAEAQASNAESGESEEKPA